MHLNNDLNPVRGNLNRHLKDRSQKFHKDHQLKREERNEFLLEVNEEKVLSTSLHSSRIS